MTLRHIVLMKLETDTGDGFVESMHQAVRALARDVPEVLADGSGRDVSGKPDNFDYALVFDFADGAAYERYRVHPAHQDFIARFMRGRPIEKVRIQLNVGDASG